MPHPCRSTFAQQWLSGEFTWPVVLPPPLLGGEALISSVPSIPSMANAATPPSSSSCNAQCMPLSTIPAFRQTGRGGGSQHTRHVPLEQDRTTCITHHASRITHHASRITFATVCNGVTLGTSSESCSASRGTWVQRWQAGLSIGCSSSHNMMFV